MPASSDEVQKIGFNQSVERAARKLHVQTEVLIRSQITIKTTVLEGGVVRFIDTQTLPADIGNLMGLQEIEALVLAQHRRNVEKVTVGAGD
jgi:hypothetical protein